MPFKSEKQRRYMWARHPRIARKWTKKYGSSPRAPKKDDMVHSELQKPSTLADSILRRLGIRK